jgi:hypothetical protein
VSKGRRIFRRVNPFVGRSKCAPKSKVDHYLDLPGGLFVVYKDGTKIRSGYSLYDLLGPDKPEGDIIEVDGQGREIKAWRGLGEDREGERMTEERKTLIRRARRECSKCYRGPKIVGHAFTAFICSLCGEEKSYPNTGVPKVCDECCEKKGVCCRCGGPMD